MKWRLIYTTQAQKDAKKLASSGLEAKDQTLWALIAEDPYRKLPQFEKLIGDLARGAIHAASIFGVVWSTKC